MKSIDSEIEKLIKFSQEVRKVEKKGIRSSVYLDKLNEEVKLIEHSLNDKLTHGDRAESKSFGKYSASIIQYCVRGFDIANRRENIRLVMDMANEISEFMTQIASLKGQKFLVRGGGSGCETGVLSGKSGISNEDKAFLYLNVGYSLFARLGQDGRWETLYNIKTEPKQYVTMPHAMFETYSRMNSFGKVGRAYNVDYSKATTCGGRPRDIEVVFGDLPVDSTFSRGFFVEREPVRVNSLNKPSIFPQ